MIKKIVLIFVSCLPLINISYAAKLFFSWADTIIQNCPTNIDIYLDTQWEEIWTAWVNVILNNDEFIINKFESENWVFRLYPAPKILTARKIDFKWQKFLRLIGTTSSAKGFVWTGLFGTLTITANKDKVKLAFYMIPGYDGEDSNLALNNNGKIKDVLTEIENKTLTVIPWNCNVEQLEPIKIENIKPSIFAEDTQYQIEDTVKINKANIFDAQQADTRFKKNINYITIIVALMVIVLIIKLSHKKHISNKKEHK